MLAVSMFAVVHHVGKRFLPTLILLHTLQIGLRVGVALAVGATTERHADVRVGIIGLDTSHVIVFTSLLNAQDPAPQFAGCRIVAAYPLGSPDIPSSIERVPKYTAQVRELGVEIVDSLDDLLSRVDAVLLESNDGRPHLQQVLPCLQAKKPTFIDKPIAGSLADTLAILAAAEQFGTPVFSASSLRYGTNTTEVRQGKIGKVLGCDTYGPCSIEPTHPDLFWYGIHGVESLLTVMGTGCSQVTRVHTADADVVVGEWEGGRIGSFRGMRIGTQGFGGIAFGEKGNSPVGENSGYEPLLAEIVKFFHGGPPSVTAAETIEIMAFMEAADESKRQGGRPVAIQAVLDKAQRRP